MKLQQLRDCSIGTRVDKESKGTGWNPELDPDVYVFLPHEEGDMAGKWRKYGLFNK